MEPAYCVAAIPAASQTPEIPPAVLLPLHACSPLSPQELPRPLQMPRPSHPVGSYRDILLQEWNVVDGVVPLQPSSPSTSSDMSLESEDEDFAICPSSVVTSARPQYLQLPTPRGPQELAKREGEQCSHGSRGPPNSMTTLPVTSRLPEAQPNATSTGSASNIHPSRAPPAYPVHKWTNEFWGRLMIPDPRTTKAPIRRRVDDQRPWSFG